MKDFLKDITGKYYDDNKHCALSIVCGANSYFHLSIPEEVVSGFGGGLMGNKCLCGALNASVVVLGSLFKGNKLKKAVDKLYTQFSNKNKSTCCRVITRNVKWGSGEHKNQCKAITMCTAEHLEDIINACRA